MRALLPLHVRLATGTGFGYDARTNR